jgi:transglutaminase-like putative cysteine protease
VTERWTGLAILAAAVAVAQVTPVSIAAAALVLPLAAVLLGPRWELDRLGQAAATVGAMAAGVVAPRVLGGAPLEGEISLVSERAVLFAMPVLGIGAVRALLVAPRFGAPVTLAAGLVALTAAGSARPGLGYPLLCGAFLTCAFASLARAAPGRASPRSVGRRHLIVTGLAVAVAAVTTVAAAVTLPGLQEAAMRHVLQRFRSARTGFSDRVVLGALGGMLNDDRVVMRVRGPDPPRLLRGAVLSGYSGGVWDAPRRLPVAEVVEVGTRAPAGPGVTEIEIARRADRYFLPLDAQDVTTSSGFFSRDVLGIYRPIRGFEAKRLWLRTGGQRSIWPPTPADRAIPTALGVKLHALLADWDALRGSPQARLEHIDARLNRDFRYSTSFNRPPGHDPIADFLLENRQGHCEYFAGAMVLLARAAGVPARVVTGYRVAERSPWGYLMVRRRHAHAWVEAWVDGRWATFDPTPPDPLLESMPGETPPLGAFLDGLATSWEVVDDWLAARTPFELSMTLVVVVGVGLLYLGLRGRTGRTASPRAVEPPLPGFLALGRALARRGLAREDAETLERFRTRVATTERLDPAARERVAGALKTYAELRYAGRGDEPVVDRELVDLARTL